VSRDEILRFALDVAKDEYGRGQSRLGLVETKAALVSATVGILLALLATIGPKDLPHGHAGDAILVIGTFVSLILSLIWSIAASFLREVDAPQSALDVCNLCEGLIGDPGQPDGPVDLARAEIVVGNLAGSYVAASSQIAELLSARMATLRRAQVALIVGILFMVILLGPVYLGTAVGVLSHTGW
jgi:hypothetical protein